MTKLCTFNCQSATLSTVVPYHHLSGIFIYRCIFNLFPTRLALKSVKVQSLALLLSHMTVRILVFQSAKWAFYEYLPGAFVKINLFVKQSLCRAGKL